MTPGLRSSPELSIFPPRAHHLARINEDLSPLDKLEPYLSEEDLHEAYLLKWPVMEVA